MHDLLIYLLNNNKRITISSRNQLKFLEAINVLEILISSMKNDITDQSEEQKKKIFAEQESVLNNAELLLKKEMIQLISLQKII